MAKRKVLYYNLVDDEIEVCPKSYWDLNQCIPDDTYGDDYDPHEYNPQECYAWEDVFKTNDLLRDYDDCAEIAESSYELYVPIEDVIDYMSDSGWIMRPHSFN